MKWHRERDSTVRVPQSNVAASLASDFPSVASRALTRRCSDMTGRAPVTQGPGTSAGSPSVKRASVFAHPLDVERKRLLGIRRRFIEGVALGVQTGKVRGVDVVATLVLWSEDKLDFSRLIHRAQDRHDFGRGQAQSGTDSSRKSSGYTSSRAGGSRQTAIVGSLRRWVRPGCNPRRSRFPDAVVLATARELGGRLLSYDRGLSRLAGKTA